MERSQPLRRYARLEPGDKGLRRTPIARKVPQQRTTRQARPRTAPRNTGATVDVKQQVDSRDLGRCLICGAPASNRQHRQGRGSGGRGKAESTLTNGVAWLFLICGQGNTSGCHKAVDEDRETSIANGWVIRRNGPDVDAATVPILCYDGWHLLTDDACRVPVAA